MSIREVDTGRDQLPEPLTYTVKQAAAALGIGYNTTARLVRSGEIESFRVGRHVKVPVKAVELYIDRQAFGPRDGR